MFSSRSSCHSLRWIAGSLASRAPQRFLCARCNDPRQSESIPGHCGRRSRAGVRGFNADLGRCRRLPGRNQRNLVSRRRARARAGHSSCERALRIPPSPYLRSIQVPPGFDVADKRIVELLAAADLVITADIPLAAAVIDKGAHALNPRGELYTKDNIRERLPMRNFMDELRGSGVTTGGPGALNARDRQAFANSLDAFLAKHVRR